MKRFYCTICKRVKRARNIPSVMFNYAAPLPEDRLGECDSHYASRRVQRVVTGTWNSANDTQAEARFVRTRKVGAR